MTLIYWHIARSLIFTCWVPSFLCVISFAFQCTLRLRSYAYDLSFSGMPLHFPPADTPPPHPFSPSSLPLSLALRRVGRSRVVSFAARFIVITGAFSLVAFLSSLREVAIAFSEVSLRNPPSMFFDAVLYVLRPFFSVLFCCLFPVLRSIGLGKLGSLFSNVFKRGSHTYSPIQFHLT